MADFPSEHLLADYEALTRGCGCWELTQWSVISLTGQDRVRFLHNMCTADIRGLSVGAGSEAFVTNVQGKILAHVLVLVREKQIDLLTVPGQAPALLEHLERYIIREDVLCQDRTAEQVWTHISGSQAPAVLQALAPAASSLPKRSWQSVPYPVGGQERVLARAEMVWPESYLVSAAVAELLPHSRRFQEVTVAEAWMALRLESGWPCWGIDFSAQHLPQEIARDQQAISFHKGCYLGQETIARIDALGRVNQQLCTVQFSADAIPPPDTPLLLAGQQVGQVTTCGWSPARQAPLGLGMVRRGANAVGTQLASAAGTATVVSLAAASEDFS